MQLASAGGFYKRILVAKPINLTVGGRAAGASAVDKLRSQPAHRAGVEQRGGEADAIQVLQVSI